jgi:hypothetical protein
MNELPRRTGSLQQQPLQFLATDDQIELWNGFTERQKQECRQALRQMLAAVVRQPRNTVDDHRGSLDHEPEGLTHD